MSKPRSGRFQSGNGSPGNATRRMFTKLLMDESATMSSLQQAERFLDGFDSFDNKGELLQKLDDKRHEGSRRINEVMSFVDGSVEMVDRILIRFLKSVMTDNTAKPLQRSLRNKILNEVYLVPGLLGMIEQADVVVGLTTQSAALFCQFLVELAKGFVEARCDDNVVGIAKKLVARGDLHNESRVLVTLVLVAPNNKVTAASSLQAVSRRDVALWVSDETPPGGRHDNDHLNFRNIRIVPTAEELSCDVRSWLPLASGENNFDDDTVRRVVGNSFRLLRDDAVQTMKTRINESQRCWSATIGDMIVSVSRGHVCFVVHCKHNGNRKIDWKVSRALGHGSVLAFCKDARPEMLGTIIIRDEKTKGEWLNNPHGPKIGVTFDLRGIHFKLALQNLIDNASVLQKDPKKSKIDQNGTSEIPWSNNRLSSYDLVEASTSFCTYQPILSVLQDIVDLPFHNEICSETSRNNENAVDYLPAIVQLPGNDICRGIEIDRQSFSIDDVVRRTTLDESQARALRHVLTNRVALVQGPPGTGKTFLGALVAQSIRENTAETILCVCFTNHALDQFLEHMLDAGENRLVRIGGRSKSKKLAKFQLRELARSKVQQTAQSSNRVKQIDAQLHQVRQSIEEKVQTLKGAVQWSSPNGGFRQLLEDNHPDLKAFLQIPDLSDGFEIIGPNSKPIRHDFLWRRWSRGESFPEMCRILLSDIVNDALENFWSLDFAARGTMISEWKKEILSGDIEHLNLLVAQFEQLVQERNTIRQERDLEILKDARVIGATTTGAAQNKDLLHLAGAGVLIIEEAGEVLEAHVLSALDPSTTKHLILIGDHQQLRPKVESYGLSVVSGKGYALDCSLFERLVLAKLPSATLNVQHRMRPEISEFIRIQTYPNLVDHASVKNFPSVRGCDQNVLFINHNIPEDSASHDGDDSGKSKTNIYEIELGVEIARFFLMQGYSPARITILTPYLGQLLHLLRYVKKELSNVATYLSEKDKRDLDQIDELDENRLSEYSSEEEDDSLRCSSIDNYQGEENDIIIILLVRSNNHGSIGFLKEEQRVNVLMSRARFGMYLIGNAQTLTASTKGSTVWLPIIRRMESLGQIQEGLPTHCQLHPKDETVLLKKPSDFRKYRPNGGCQRPCSFRMDCGHTCSLSCHPFDRTHTTVQKDCCEPCQRVPSECGSGHRCPKLCKEKCGQCRATVGPIKLLGCNHLKDQVYCHEIRNEEAKIELANRCRVLMAHKFSKCGHTVETECSNVKSDSPICPKQCGCIVPACNHLCSNSCGTCTTGNHLCNQPCQRQLFCGHLCGKPCHPKSDCPPCEAKCDVVCCHSSCPKRCHSKCASCVEPCSWECAHMGRCQLVCGAPCSRLPCSQRCDKILECGHRCPSLCGEPCPPEVYCKECCDELKGSHVVDMVLMSSYYDHDVDEDPILVLPCGHFFATSTLDGHLGLSEVYNKATGDTIGYTTTKSLASASINEKPKTCPDCRKMIHSIYRFGRILRFSELRALERKHSMEINASLKHVENRLEHGHEHEQLIKQIKALQLQIRKSPMTTVYEACEALGPDHDIPQPPLDQSIRILELKGRIYSMASEAFDDWNENTARESFLEAMEIADSSKFLRTGASIRLLFCKHVLRWEAGLPKPKKTEVLEMLDRVIQLSNMFPDLAEKASTMKASFLAPTKEIREVLAAMNIVGGYNYGGSWSSHWYECPNGHPYFIGECGGAMQASTCIECRASIGGTGHVLNSSNRPVQGLIARALVSNNQS